MNYKTKIDLIFEGYSTDTIGLLTYTLNKRFKISESKLREILNIKIIIENKIDNDVIKTAVDRLLELPDNPTDEEIVAVLYDVFDMFDLSELATPDKIFQLTNQIRGNWKDYTLLRDLPGEEQTIEELPDVPKIGDNLVLKRSGYSRNN